MSSKKFSHCVHSHSSGRVKIFLQFNSHLAGGWGRATREMSVPLWQTTPNLGFTHQEMQPVFLKETFLHCDDTRDS